MLIGRKSTAQHGLPGQARQRRGRGAFQFNQTMRWRQ